MKRDPKTGQFYGEKIGEPKAESGATAPSPRMDDHYRRLPVGPREIMQHLAPHLPSVYCWPYGEALAHLMRAPFKAGREDLEKAREHIEYLLSIWHEGEPPR